MSDEQRHLKIFLCHAHTDREAVRDIYVRLKRAGVDVWLDKEKLIPGANWEYEIRKAVHESDVVIVCLSRQFNQAGFRQKEVRLALDTAMGKPEGEIFIIPARLEECDAPESMSKWHWVDLFESDGFQRLLMSLRIHANRIGATLRIHKGGTATLSHQKSPRSEATNTTDSRKSDISSGAFDSKSQPMSEPEQVAIERTSEQQRTQEFVRPVEPNNEVDNDLSKKTRLYTDDLAKQKVPQEKADSEVIENISGEKTASDFLEKARLDTQVIEQKKTANEASDSIATEEDQGEQSEKAIQDDFKAVAIEEPGITDEKVPHLSISEGQQPAAREKSNDVEHSEQGKEKAAKSVSKLTLVVITVIVIGVFLLWAWISAFRNSPTTSVTSEPNLTQTDIVQQPTEPVIAPTVPPDGKIVFGPASGTIVHDASDGRGASVGSGVSLKNFVMQARLFNPYRIDKHPWISTIDFRETWTNHSYYLYLSSDRSWHLDLNNSGEWNTIASGDLKNLDVSETGSNLVKLLVVDQELSLYLNDELVDNLTLSGEIYSGDVRLVVSLEFPGESTRYADFTVRELP
jgi:hypothetical protein